MIALAFKAIKDHAIWVFALSFIAWVIFLTLVDLSIFVLTGKETDAAPYEESETDPRTKSDCVEIKGTKVCR